MLHFAASDVAKLEARRDVKRLLKVLAHDPSVGQRQAAAAALGTLGDARAVAGLLEALSDPGWEVRAMAARALGRLGDARAVEPLIASLRDDRPDVLKEAVDALVLFRDPRAAEPLVSMLGVRFHRWLHEDFVHDAVMAAVTGLAGPCVQPLIALLRDRRMDAREDAVHALGEIGDARAVYPLVPLLSDPEIPVRQSAARALDRLGWHPAGEQETIAYQAARREYLIATRDWASLGAWALEPLLEILRGSPARDEAAEAAQALGKLGDARAIPALIPLLRDRRRPVSARGYRDWVCFTAAEALDRLGWTPGSGEAAVAYAVAKWDWGRCAQIGAGAAEPLISLLEDRTQPASVRMNAAKTLGEIADARAVEPLIASLNDRDIWICRKAAEALVRMFHSGKLDDAAKAKILAERDTITYEEPDVDEEHLGNRRDEDRSMGVDFPL